MENQEEIEGSSNKPETESKVLVLIDSNAIIHRAYHALPKTMSTSKGELTNAVYGYATTLIRVLEDLHPTHIAASFDISRATFRLAEYADYKAKRVKADQELYDQIPSVRELLEVFNIPIYEKEGYEADDCIGTLSDKFEERNPKQVYKGFKVFIVTGDKDAFQLIDGNIFVYNLKKGLSETQIANRQSIKDDWQLDPEDFIDLKALAGDPSDNIPGVPGIGPKTATELLQKFDTLKDLYRTLEELLPDDLHQLISNIQYPTNNQCSKDQELKIKKMNEDWKLGIESLPAEYFENILVKLKIKPRIAKLLLTNKDQAFLSQRLATICRDVPLDFKLEDMKWGDYDREKVIEFFKKMQFHSLLRRFGIEKAEEPKTKEAKEQKEKDEQLKLL